MSDTYCEAYFHFNWATKNRVPYISSAVESVLLPFIERKCAEHGVVVIALNAMPDHVHLACSMPATVSPSQLMQWVKGSSSHFINKEANLDAVIGWQSGFGALTFSRSAIPRVSAYIKNQKQHHAENTTNPALERVGPI